MKARKYRMLDIRFRGINITPNNLDGPLKNTLMMRTGDAPLACSEET